MGVKRDEVCKALPSWALSRERQEAVEEDIRGRSNSRGPGTDRREMCAEVRSRGAGMGSTRLCMNFQRMRSAEQ